MSNIDKQTLSEAAEKALQGRWDYEAGAIWNTDESGWVQHMAVVEAGDDVSDEEHKSNMRFITLATPAVVLGLLDELEAKDRMVAGLSKLLSDIQKGRPGGVYFNKWDAQISNALRAAAASKGAK